MEAQQIKFRIVDWSEGYAEVHKDNLEGDEARKLLKELKDRFGEFGRFVVECYDINEERQAQAKREYEERVASGNWEDNNP